MNFDEIKYLTEDEYLSKTDKWIDGIISYKHYAHEYSSKIVDENYFIENT